MSFFFKRLLRDLIGIVFCISAVFKMMDPVGTGLAVEAYFNFFHLGFLMPAAKAFGVIISIVEGVIGVGLLTGVFRRFFAYATMILIGFFTVITLILLIANPAMECGCFGEAIPLTHAQTFIKNLILCALAAATFIPVYGYEVLPGRSFFSFGACCLLLVFFASASLYQIPAFDFTTFAPSHTIVPADQATGDDEYPTLTLWDEDGNDRSDEILDGFVALVSFYRPDEAEEEDINKTRIFVENAYNAGITPVILTTGDLHVEGATKLHGDFKDLITLNRSNGGVTFLHNGYIIRKRSAHLMLEADDLTDIANSDPTEAYIKAATWRSVTLQALILVFFSVLLLL